METGNDGQRCVGFDDEHQCVRKAAEQGSADVLMDDRKLLGIGSHTLDHVANRRAEVPPQTGNCAVYIPPFAKSAKDGAPGRQGEGNGIGYGH
jgi:hypothetical protein